jgi:hypothetical protein
VVAHLLFVSHIVYVKSIPNCTIEGVIIAAVRGKVEAILRFVAVGITICNIVLPYFEVATDYGVLKPCVALVYLGSCPISSASTYMAV